MAKQNVTEWGAQSSGNTLSDVGKTVGLSLAEWKHVDTMNQQFSFWSYMYSVES